MKLKILHSRVMVDLSRQWLHDEELRAELVAHVVGTANLMMLEEAHDELLAQQNLRDAIEMKIRGLNKLIDSLNFTYDSKARSIYYHLDALAEGADDPALAAFYRDLKELIFPDGLRIVQSSYREQSGAVGQLAQRITPEVLKQLADIRVGRQTLADLYRAWVEAGEDLGERIYERATLKGSLTLEGTNAAKAHSRPIREKWIRAVHSLVGSLDTLPLSDGAREKIRAPLEQSIADALRRRRPSVPDSDGAGDTDDVLGAGDAADPAEVSGAAGGIGDTGGNVGIGDTGGNVGNVGDAGDTAEFVPPSAMPGHPGPGEEAPPA